MLKEEGTNPGAIFWPLLALNVFLDELKMKACKEVIAYLFMKPSEEKAKFFEGATVFKDLQLSEKLVKQVFRVVSFCRYAEEEQIQKEIAKWVLRQPQSVAKEIGEVVAAIYMEVPAVITRVILCKASRIPPAIMHLIFERIIFMEEFKKYDGADNGYIKDIFLFTDLLIAALGNPRICVEMLVNRYADDLGQPTVKKVLKRLAKRSPVIPEQPITHAEALVDVSATASPSNSNPVEAIEGQSSVSTDTVVHRAGSETKKRRAPVPDGEMKKLARPNLEK